MLLSDLLLPKISNPTQKVRGHSHCCPRGMLLFLRFAAAVPNQAAYRTARRPYPRDGLQCCKARFSGWKKPVYEHIQVGAFFEQRLQKALKKPPCADIPLTFKANEPAPGGLETSRRRGEAVCCGQRESIYYVMDWAMKTIKILWRYMIYFITFW